MQNFVHWNTVWTEDGQVVAAAAVAAKERSRAAVEANFIVAEQLILNL